MARLLQRGQRSRLGPAGGRGGAERPKWGALMGLRASARRPGRATPPNLSPSTHFNIFVELVWVARSGRAGRAAQTHQSPALRPLRPPAATGWTQPAALTTLQQLDHCWHGSCNRRQRTISELWGARSVASVRLLPMRRCGGPWHGCRFVQPRYFKISLAITTLFASSYNDYRYNLFRLSAFIRICAMVLRIMVNFTSIRTVLLVWRYILQLSIEGRGGRLGT